MNQEREKKRFTIEINDELYKKMKILCVQNDISLKEFITQAIKEKLQK